MKYLFALLLTFAATAHAQVERCDSGSWSVPAFPEGINLEVHEDAYYAYFYTHDGFDQAWLLLVGNPETGLADVYDTITDGTLATAHEIGSARLTTAQGRLVFSWNIQFDFGRDTDGIPWCLSGCRGEMELNRLTRLCE